MVAFLIFKFEVMKIVLVIVFAAMACCAHAQQIGKRILFIGDSVTDGNWGGCGTERSLTDMNHIFGHGYMSICASHYMSLFPERDYHFYNRGISGNTVADLKNRLRTDVIDLKPNVVSILVGVNDIFAASCKNSNINYDDFESDYRYILQTIREQNSDVEIVLCDCFAKQGLGRTQNAKFWADACPKINKIVASLAIEYGARHIEYQKMFDKLDADNRKPSQTYWIWDGIHPTPAAHQKMAELWMSVMDDIVRE